MNPRRIIALFVLLEVFIIVVAVVANGFSLAALQTITRFSGRLSLLVFSVIFLIHHKPETLHSWLSDKFYLLFAIVHGIHLVELLAFVYLSQVPLIPIRLAGGFLAYALVFAMPMMSHRASTGHLSSGKFYLVQTFFMYYTWLIFFLTYLPRVQGKLPNAGGNYAEHVALLGWVATMLGIKLANVIEFKKNR